MSKQERKAIKRIYAQGHNHLEEAGKRLFYLYQKFEPHHQDYAEYIMLMLQALDILLQQYRVLGERAWGKVPDDLNTWRQ